MITIGGLNIANNGFFYLRWFSDDVSGTGERDELALDDITVQFSDSPLPVELVSFNILSKANKVFLNWTTGSEIENAGFEVFRAEKTDILNNNSFKRIASYITNDNLRGLGSSALGKKYSFTDDEFLLRQGATYIYKIADIANDGTRKEHEPKEVLLEETDRVKVEMISAWPNPADDNASFTLFVPEESNMSIEIYNEIGMRVLSPVTNVVFSTGKNTVNFSLLTLPTGMYTIRFTGAMQSATSQFIIAR